MNTERPVGKRELSEEPLKVVMEDGSLTDPAFAERISPDELSHLISTLRPRVARVINLRYGFEDGKRRTLEEVGREFGVGRNRARQLEQEGFKKIPALRDNLKQHRP